MNEAHARLLDRYRIGPPPPPWHEVGDDGYLYGHLIWHLENASRSEEIHELLWAEDVAGKNGWYEARERLGQTSGYLADLERARGLADEDFARNPTAIPMTRQARYALIRASLNSLAGGIPDGLLEQLVDHGVWTVGAALTYARCMPDEFQGVRARVALLPRLDLDSRRTVAREALELARTIGDAADRAFALTALSTHLNGPSQAAVGARPWRRPGASGDASSRSRTLRRWPPNWTNRLCARPWRRPGASGMHRIAPTPWPRWRRTWSSRRVRRSRARPWRRRGPSGTRRTAPGP